VHFTVILIIAVSLEVMKTEGHKYQRYNSCRHHKPTTKGLKCCI